MQKVQEVLFSRFGTAASLLERAVAQKSFPAAVIELGDATGPLWRQAFGRLRFEADAPVTAEDTIFDLASLTKVMATTTLVMQEVERGAIGLDDPVGRYVAAWQGADRVHVTIRDLLAHSAGLTAYVPFYLDYRLGSDPLRSVCHRVESPGEEGLPSGEVRAEFERAVCRIPLEYAPRTKSVYSDLGFMLLGFILGRDVGLPTRFDAMRSHMGILEDVQFNPPTLWKSRTAPTGVDSWRGRLLVGEVHDENAATLQGAAGHAGLFGTAAACGQHASHMLRVLDGKAGAFSRATAETFITCGSDVPESSRALGWDTMLPGSSCGSRMSRRAFGHTGFTGTSLWIDPERGVYVVLLTNRVHPTRANETIREVRPTVHDAVMEAFAR